MTVDDYKYVSGKPSKYPMWGKELAERKLSTKTVIVITSAYFDSGEETGELVGIRSIWHIDDDLMKAKIVGIQKWIARDPTWQDDQTSTVSAGHRSVLAGFLMARWSKGKLRGRIDDTL